MFIESKLEEDMRPLSGVEPLQSPTFYKHSMPLVSDNIY